MTTKENCDLIAFARTALPRLAKVCATILMECASAPGVLRDCSDVLDKLNDAEGDGYDVEAGALGQKALRLAERISGIVEAATRAADRPAQP